jgi:AcrR family transcriptional regulator
MVTVDAVRERILSRGLSVASAQGLHALSIGDLARELDLSRSGLFAHFATKESLQLGVLEQAAEMFVHEVIDPGRAPAVGDARVRLLFTKWLAWSRSPRLKGGCPFVHASAESQALPAQIRARLKEILDHWSAVLAEAIEEAKAEGRFRPDLEANQLVFELYGLYLSHHFWHWSMRDAQAHARTIKAFERLIDASGTCCPE